MHTDTDLVVAPATPRVLAALSEGESYGYAIVKRMRELSGGALEWPDGMVYPLFRRLRRLGYLTTEWRITPEGRRRRYYTITDDGRAVLARRPHERRSAGRAPDRSWPRSGLLFTALRVA